MTTLLTSQTEIEIMYSTIGVDLRSDDLQSPNLDTMWDDLIEAATDTLASYTLKYYNTDKLANSKWARRRATIIGCYYLSLRRANGAQFYQEYLRVIEELEKFLGANPPIIPGVPARASNIPTVSSYVVDDRNRYKKLRVRRDYSTKPYPGQYGYVQPFNTDYQ